jgi:hypothetical protein
MTAFRLVFFLACALLLPACNNPRQRAESQLRNGGDIRLRHDAAMIYKDLFAGTGKPDFVEVWYRDWPTSFQRLAPLHVGAYHDGVIIALRASLDNESGLYIIPESMDKVPNGERGSTFIKLREGIYWYSFGAR